MVRGAAVMRWAWAKWQGSWKVTRRLTVAVGAWNGSPTKNSVTSSVISLNRVALVRYSGSSFSNSAYSFMLAPQPADEVMIRSTPAAIRESMLARAMVRAFSRSPAWVFNAPQHL